jgi:hypothetical protein
MAYQEQVLSLLRLRVLADPDPGALARVLERFQNLNVLPRRVIAEWGIDETLHIEVDVLGLTAEQVSLVAAKVCQHPTIVNAYWHRV